jgi:adenine-specific DNA methylase
MATTNLHPNSTTLTDVTRQLSAAQAIEDLHVNGIQMPDAALGFRVQQYGITNFLDLFTKRQAISLQTFAEEVAAIREEIVADARNAGMPDDQLGLESGDTGAHAYADAILCVLGLCVGKMAQSNNILVRWFIDPRNGSGKATPAFDRHAIPMVWDFVETNPFGGSVGDWTGPVLETALRAFDLTVSSGIPTKILQLDARKVGARLVSVRARGGNWMNVAGGVGPGGRRSRPEGPTPPAIRFEVAIGSDGYGGVARLHPNP